MAQIQQVNTTTENIYETAAEIVSLADGGWIVTWSSSENGEGVIHQQRYASDGARVGQPDAVVSYTGYFYAATATALPDGGWLVAWQMEDYGKTSGVHFQRYDQDGSKAGEVVTVGEGYNQTPQVTVLADGGWLTAWSNATTKAVEFQRFDANGELAGEVQAANLATGAYSRVETVGLADGGWVMTWIEDNDPLATDSVMQAVYDGDGNLLTENNLVVTGMAEPKDPSVAALVGGGYVLCWTSGQTIYQQRFDAGGQAVDQEPVDYEGKVYYQGNGPRVAALPDGGWVLVWSAYGGPSNALGAEVHARAFNADGQPVGKEIRVDDFDSYNFDPDVAVLEDGRWVVSWTSHVNANETGTDVFQRILSGAPADNEPPSDIMLSAASVREDAAVGTLVGLVSGEDPDGDALSFELVGNKGKFFALNGDRLEVAKALDFETRQEITIRLRATDEGGASFAKTFTVSVTDVLETIKGNGKDNKIDGGAGADLIKGLGGNDVIRGLGGDDILNGGRGKDALTGGGGSDTFVFATGDSGKARTKADTIFDFTKEDTIDLGGWDANSKKSGDQDFKFIGTQDFHGKAGELRFVKEKSDTWIEGDTNGDGKADFLIHLDDAFKLKESHFEL